MGNAGSQPSRRSKSLYLFYLIHRTWSIVTDHRKEHDSFRDIDEETDLSSRCSGCNDCAYRQDSLTFDSESDMAPNAEEELLVVKPRGPQSEKERLRPPTYNAEDYALALKRWGRRPLNTSTQDPQGTLPSTTSSSSGYASGSGEMTLRQFTSVSELLNKLRADLRLAFPSFVQEFASPPSDGITLLLETLRGVQLAQSAPPTPGQAGPRIGTRRAALDELGCVECLAACGERCPDAPRLLAQAQPGLLALAVCLTSSLNRSRVLALQLLTKVCQTAGGHEAVSEAVSTMRLRYGEGARFRFLAGALLAPRAAIALRVAGVAFLNAFLKSAPRTQTRLYIQTEACEAGLEPQILQEWLREFDGREEDALTDLLHKEVQKWAQNCVDVDALQRRVLRAEKACRILGKKVSALQNQLQKTQLEKLNSYNLDGRKNSSSALLDAKKTQKVSSNGEDEGISSSERSSSPEGTNQRIPHQNAMLIQDNDQETTIDDVIEELRIIVKDAEEEFSEKNQERNRADSVLEQEVPCNDRDPSKQTAFRPRSKASSNNSESYLDNDVFAKRSSQKDETTLRANNVRNASPSQTKGEQITYFGNDRDCSIDSSITRRLSSSDSRSRISRSSTDGSVRIVVKGPDVEEAIVPAILHPQPPRRTPPCLSSIMATRRCDFVDHEEVYNSHDDDDIEEETLGDGSDSLLSASRLKYNGKDRMYEDHVRGNTNQKQATTSNGPILESGNVGNDGRRKSFSDLRHFEADDASARKTIRNYESSKDSKARTAPEATSIRHPDVYRQYESNATSKAYETTSKNPSDRHSSVHRHSSKYRSEIEKRKHLRRSSSHDYLESSTSTPRSRRSVGSRVECRIRKFESLNSFDEHRSLQNYGRPCSSDNLNKQDRQVAHEDTSRSRMRRSESFHHVSHIARKDQCSSSRGGSDSGLVYITDFNLEPLVTRRPKSIEVSESPLLHTKSLDRIDEGGLDTMARIVDGGNASRWKTSARSSKMNKFRGDVEPNKVTKNWLNSFENNNSERLGKERISESITRSKQTQKDDTYGDYANDKQLKNDELYEQRNRQWSYKNELNSSKNKELEREQARMILPKSGVRHESFCQNDGKAKFSSRSTDSGIFAGRTYDTFGIGKNRFNAGKYSGSHQIKENPVGRRNTTSSFIGKRGKVTDVVSGLY